MRLHFEYRSHPVPHLYVSEVVAPDLYASLRFPDIPARPLGRIGRDLYAGEPGYDDVVSRSPWASVHGQLTGEPFVRETLRLFRADMERARARLDPDRAVLEPYAESREETESPELGTGRGLESIFCRFDFQVADASYRKPPHLDHPRRVVGGVFFCSDADEEDIVGGEFAFFEDLRFRNDRICHRPRVARRYPVRHNTAVLFLNHNRAFHGPLPIERARGARRWIYYSISSHQDVWPFAPPGRRRRGVRSRLRSAFSFIGR